jgi:broad specificity phosphatase PhoE
MKAFTLTLLRHGDIAARGRLIGRTELPLTRQGERQMASSWQRIAAIPVQSMACSPRLRCRPFAVEQSLERGVPLKVDARFAECDFGDWEGEPTGELAAAHPDWYSEMVAGRLTPPGGESFAAFRDRVLAGFADWIAESRGSHRVLVTHGGVISVLLAELLGTSFAVARLMTVQRGGFAQLSLLDGHPAYLVRLELPDA